MIGFHVHRCEHCGTTFSHDKRKIPSGRSFEAHYCPGCGLMVNTRADDWPGGDVQFPEWYGPPADVKGDVPGLS